MDDPGVRSIFLATILVTGAAGFIGFHLCERLLALGHRVIGYDSVNDFYSLELKEARLALLRPHADFVFVQAALEEADVLNTAFETHRPEIVVNLAAQAGVRYSVTHPAPLCAKQYRRLLEFA